MPEDDTRIQLIQALMLPAFLFIVGWLSFAASAPPEPLAMDAGGGDFSALRAYQHVKVIAREPHPMGTPEAREVRDYIMAELEALGFETEIQRTEMFYDYSRFGRPPIMATVENIIARKAGTAGTGKDLVLMAHYDSRPQANGASDDGAGVATILETVRALDNLPPLKNDLMVLITDGEEMGLLGAQGFFHDKTLADQVGLILNFEARGSSGTVYMFETSVGNGALIEQLQRAAPRAFANSISYEVYNRMPNDTDLSISKEAGLQGLNFAFIDGFYDYHTPGDNADNISLKTLQQMGNYALAMSRTLGEVALPLPEEKDAVYFNLVGSLLVSYPMVLSWLVLAAALAALAGAIYLARKQKAVAWPEMARGLGAFVLMLALLALVISGLYGLIAEGADSLVESRRLFAQASEQLTGFIFITYGFLVLTGGLMARGMTRNELLVLIITPAILLALGGNLGLVTGAVLLLAAATLWFFFRRPLGLWAFSLGALLLWAIAAVAVQVTATTASYFFAWPLLAAALAHIYLFRRGTPEPAQLKSQALILLGALLGLHWLLGDGYFVHQALGIFMPALTMVLVALAAGLMMPALISAARGRARFLAMAIGLAGLFVIVQVGTNRGFDERLRQPTELFYLVEGGMGESFWASRQPVLDPWNRQLLGATPFKANQSLLNPARDNVLWLAAAPMADVASPRAEPLSEAYDEDGRALKFRVFAGGRGDLLLLSFAPAGNIRAASVNGHALELPEAPGEWWRWRYYAVPEAGLEIEIQMTSDETLRLHLAEVDYALPAEVVELVPKMPADYMLMPYSLAGATVAITWQEFSALPGSSSPGSQD